MAAKMDFQHYAPQIDRIHKATPKETASIAFWNTVRENFTISTWMAMGAVLQGLLVLFARPTFAVAPAALLLLYRFSHTMLMHYGVIRNTQMADVISGKYTVQIPDKDGNPPSEPSGTDVAVIMLGLRNNHALGMFGTGGRETFLRFKAMFQELEDNKDSGFLGSSWYRSANERLTGNGFMTVCYFRSVEDIDRFAHGPLHRDTWDWFNNLVKTHPHLSIMHEVYTARKKNWENIFINYHLTGIGKILKPVIVNGKEYTPIANAQRGPLSTHKGRIGKSGSIINEKEYLIDAEE
ncbi:uncharacterized protein TRIVIDRAFT_219507 [Trichoderma virens Gv29-8]|uniref:Monooxygenase n=1 Tax=Hypocrea virens (strain Gv29-8 / FGSC 10586) TaxID=413071 RepID=G9MJT5_HYPVG|nr:uncharacterized protein TRIVIDRAFT_219507 [Trichoderma virens Gv29-8]EHK25746.1 hypothetical protein TRIVIDRAFT_219507 [Trichoderma virens Gv29-8]UKZ48433.1 hypothetical protein TrVGV298_002656 [Trichoderma virens]UKZ74975.1 hypothetical protein TrVFT333_002645 [Trichoderma virens FT-333]